MSPDLHAASAGARVAGAILAFGYLLGVVPGPLVAVVGGLALITLGRALEADTQRALLAALALAVMAGALGISALRWATLDLSELRGAQGILGPTVLVDPPAAAAAAGVAGTAALLALALWQVTLLRGGSATGFWWGAGEALLAAGALASGFWGPALVIGGEAETTRVLTDALVWAGVLVVTTAAPVALSRWLARREPRWWWTTAAIAVVGVLAAVGVIGETFA